MVTVNLLLITYQKDCTRFLGTIPLKHPHLSTISLELVVSDEEFGYDAEYHSTLKQRQRSRFP